MYLCLFVCLFVCLFYSGIIGRPVPYHMWDHTYSKCEDSRQEKKPSEAPVSSSSSSEDASMCCKNPLDTQMNAMELSTEAQGTENGQGRTLDSQENMTTEPVTTKGKEL